MQFGEGFIQNDNQAFFPERQLFKVYHERFNIWSRRIIQLTSYSNKYAQTNPSTILSLRI